MPDVLKIEFVQLLNYLLPGFVASWIFHSLTSHPKSTPFERIIQALIFTAITQVLVLLVQGALLWCARFAAFGEWNPGVAFTWSLVWSLVVGLLFVWSAKNGWFHRMLSPHITNQLSHHSVWASAFESVENKFVVLHLKGDKPRRLKGQVINWPDQNEHGHFVLSKAEWLLGNSTISNLDVVRILVAARDVEMVEFLCQPQTTAQIHPPPPKK